MLIKFIRPVPGLAYFEGDTAELGAAQAAALIKTGAAFMIPETEHEENNPLPEDLPHRIQLFNEGFNTLAEVSAAPAPALEAIRGIGKKGAKKIQDYLTR